MASLPHSPVLTPGSSRGSGRGQIVTQSLGDGRGRGQTTMQPLGDGRGRGHTTMQRLGDGSHVSSQNSCQQEPVATLSSVLAEFIKLKESTDRHNQTMAENYAQLAQSYKNVCTFVSELGEQTFQVETSPFKDDLIAEAGILFCNTLSREPNKKDVKESVTKVLGPKLSQSTRKVKKCITFCSKRISDLRSEERRRVLGQKPYEAYAQLTTDEFAERFSNYVKAGSRHLPVYKINLAVLRKFVRTNSTCKENTFKHFNQWLLDTFTRGKPSQEEIDNLVAEDTSISYFSSNPENTSNGVQRSEEIRQAEYTAEDQLYASYPLPSEGFN